MFVCGTSTIWLLSSKALSLETLFSDEIRHMKMVSKNLEKTFRETGNVRYFANRFIGSKGRVCQILPAIWMIVKSGLKKKIENHLCIWQLYSRLSAEGKWLLKRVSYSHLKFAPSGRLVFNVICHFAS